MANGKNGNGGSRAGVVFGVSNEVIGIIGGVAIIGIGAHLLGEWLRPKQHFSRDMGSGGEKPVIVDAMYGECAAAATHPDQVHRNKDRVMASIKQRIPRLQQLVERHGNDPMKLAEGIHRNARDVLEDMEIPSQPHPSAAPPELVRLFQAQRQDNMARDYHYPGQLIIDPAERSYLENEAMSYAVTTDPVQRFRKKEELRDMAEIQRLAYLRQKYAERHAYIQQKDIEHLQDKAERIKPAQSMRGSWYPLG